MGLDMYLYKKSYVQNWDHTPPERRWEITIKRGDGEAKVINPTYVIEQVGYWRKANQIHGWFVENVQRGVDDCGTYEVEREQLVELRAKCQRVLDASVVERQLLRIGTRYDSEGTHPIMEEGDLIVDPTVAENELPIVEGFFFGGTEYTGWYLNDLEDTVRIIDEVLASVAEDNYDVVFEYSSSW